MAEAPVTFAGLLRGLRTGAQLTQGELPRTANLSVRAVSDLERGIATTPHRDTVRLLADAMQLTGPARAEYRGHRPGQASALNHLASVRGRTGEYPAAVRDFEEALGICRDLGDRAGEAEALNHLGAVRQLTGDFPAAGRDLEEALGICRELGDRTGEATSRISLGSVGEVTGDFPAAVRNFEAALGICREIGYRGG